MSKGLHKDHRHRMRMKIAENGIDSLFDHEILELVMGYAIPRKNTNDIAHDLLNRNGTFRDLFRAEPEELVKIENMGENSAWFIRLLSELFRRYALEVFESPLQLNTPHNRIRFFTPHFMGRIEECIYVAFLNAKYEVIRTELLYVGSAEAVEIREEKLLELLKTARGCHYVVMAHNHSISAVPSYFDFTATLRLYRLLKKHNVELLDHIIRCGEKGTSMEESGHMAKIREGTIPE